MKKLIEQEQYLMIVCDNKNCDFEINAKEESVENYIMYIDKACPKCGENLLTTEDYLTHQKLQNIVNWINKWFSWVTVFYKKNKERTNIEVYTHKGIHFGEVICNDETNFREEDLEETKCTWRNLEDYVKK
jgi:hypothetical protein